MWELALRVAGVVHLLIAAGNLLLPWLFDYRRRGVPGWDPFLRQIFHVHTFYIILVITGIGLLCLAFPTELSGTAMGRAICAGLTVFWAVRLVLGFAYYDRAELRRVWYFDWPFLLATLAFTGLFAACAMGLAL